MGLGVDYNILSQRTENVAKSGHVHVSQPCSGEHHPGEQADCISMSPHTQQRIFLWSKLRKGSYIGDYIGE